MFALLSGGKLQKAPALYCPVYSRCFSIGPAMMGLALFVVQLEGMMLFAQTIEK
jgi:hypothetical protein